jgi:hypothetical protein
MVNSTVVLLFVGPNGHPGKLSGMRSGSSPQKKLTRFARSIGPQGEI